MLLLQCRPGFETECAAEIEARIAERGGMSTSRAERNRGYVEVEAPGRVEPPATSELTFARQSWPVHAKRLELPEADRITPLLAALPGDLGACGGLVLEHPDTNDGKAVARFLRKFERPFLDALASRGIRLDGRAQKRLHLFFTDSRSAWLGLVDPRMCAPWPMGIPRLKLPPGAPSRSTLKLEEAFRLLLTSRERAAWLRPGMRAVDLGAAPGGWTHQLVGRGIAVVAVDNGAMDESLLGSGLVEHRREDGLRYRPRRRVDWLVCDMVERPRRITQLVADWLAACACERAIFNLKLPMKKRFAIVEECRAALRARLGSRLDLRCKHLYHDREEITVFARAA